VAMLFLATDPYPGANTETRRSLSSLKPGDPTIAKIREALCILKIPFKAPYWKADAWAHIGVPDKKVVILKSQTMDTTFFRTHRDRWEKYGYTLFSVCARSFQRMSVDEVADELKDSLHTHGKVKK
jgi:hypothetical protein